jgi:hypothetical protein
MNWRPDDLKHSAAGEPIDRAARDAVRLAHRALERFPDVVKRHKFVAGGAAVSSALVVLAGVAIARRVRSGQTAEEAVAGMTEEELSGIHLVGRESHATPADVEDPAPVAATGDAAAAASVAETANNGRASAG